MIFWKKPEALAEQSTDVCARLSCDAPSALIFSEGALSENFPPYNVPVCDDCAKVLRLKVAGEVLDWPSVKARVEKAGGQFIQGDTDYFLILPGRDPINFNPDFDPEVAHQVLDSIS